jgi:hypothetical protein
MLEDAWKAIKDRRAGDVCTVIGNGPSLNDIPKSFLVKYPTFGTNKIFLLHWFSPTYYVAVNPLVCRQSIAYINELDSEHKFIRQEYADQIDGALPLRSTNMPVFSPMPYKYVYEGYTVTYVCLQIAKYLGYKTVLLVGVDHSYQCEGNPNEEQEWKGPDVNHFDPGYFQGDKWHLPDLERAEGAYLMAKTRYERDSCQIVNLSTRTELDIFPRDGLENW